MKKRKFKLSEIALIASTRGMLGAGIGLLLSSKLDKDQRRAVAVGDSSLLEQLLQFLWR